MANFVMYEKTVSDGTSSPDEEGHRKLSLYNYLVVAFAAVGSIIYGYDLSTVATTLVSSLALCTSKWWHTRSDSLPGRTNILFVLWTG
jgi:hypothetical protein